MYDIRRPPLDRPQYRLGRVPDGRRSANVGIGMAALGVSHHQRGLGLEDGKWNYAGWTVKTSTDMFVAQSGGRRYRYARIYRMSWVARPLRIGVVTQVSHRRPRLGYRSRIGAGGCDLFCQYSTLFSFNDAECLEQLGHGGSRNLKLGGIHEPLARCLRTAE